MIQRREGGSGRAGRMREPVRGNRWCREGRDLPHVDFQEFLPACKTWVHVTPGAVACAVNSAGLRPRLWPEAAAVGRHGRGAHHASTCHRRPVDLRPAIPDNPRPCTASVSGTDRETSRKAGVTLPYDVANFEAHDNRGAGHLPHFGETIWMHTGSWKAPPAEKLYPVAGERSSRLGPVTKLPISVCLGL